ncbi:MAG: hypothetical protein H0V82_06255 [Candidatus Protochlamydia sp.]|nr:hypothetical protein [Candidatus Protochlamydia sp.]
MQLVPSINFFTPSSLPSETLHDLWLERKEHNSDDFLLKHPEMIGMRKKDGNIVLKTRSLVSDLSFLNDKDVDKGEIFCSFFNSQSNKKCIKMFRLLIEDLNWTIIEKVMSSLSSECLDELKELSNFSGSLKNASFELVTKMIIAFPKIDWIRALWDEKIYDNDYRYHYSFMDYYKDNEKKKPLQMYSHIKGKTNPNAEKDLELLFNGTHSFFNNTIFRNLDDSKKIIIKEVFLSAYPIFARAPEVLSLFDKYCTRIEKNMNTKITRLAFRAYRHNNGLWDKSYKKKQIKDVTEMFLECLTEKSITYDCSVWRAFIDIIGEKQGEKPQIAMDNIKNAISIAQYAKSFS